MSAQTFSRGQWLERGAALTAGLAAGGILVTGLASPAQSSAPSARDVEVLKLALAFEELQADLYARAVQALTLHPDWAQYAHVVHGHEQAHAAFLRRHLGAAATGVPTMRLVQAPADPPAFQRLAVSLEDLGVAFYNGQAGNLSRASLAAVARIVSVEARHAAWARDLAGQVPAPVAADPPADEAQVRSRLQQLGVSLG